MRLKNAFDEISPKKKGSSKAKQKGGQQEGFRKLKSKHLSSNKGKKTDSELKNDWESEEPGGRESKAKNREFKKPAKSRKTSHTSTQF